MENTLIIHFFTVKKLSFLVNNLMNAKTSHLSTGHKTCVERQPGSLIKVVTVSIFILLKTKINI